MKKLIFLSLILLMGSTKLCFGGCVFHNKTNYTLIAKYTLKDLISSWQKMNIEPLQTTKKRDTKSAIGRTVDIKKLELTLESNEGGTIAKRTYNKKIVVNRNEVTHIYIVSLALEDGKPPIRVGCMRKGKIICTPWQKTDNENIKMLCKERMAKNEKSYITHEKQAKFPNVWSAKIIKNQTGLPIKVNFLKETFYLEPGDVHTIEQTSKIRQDRLLSIMGNITVTQLRQKKPLKLKEEISFNPKGIQDIIIKRGKTGFLVN